MSASVVRDPIKLALADRSRGWKVIDGSRITRDYTIECDVFGTRIRDNVFAIATWYSIGEMVIAEQFKAWVSFFICVNRTSGQLPDS